MSLELYHQLLSVGKSNVCSLQTCGEYRQQLQDLHEFVYVVESTPNPCEPEYSPMFLDCILHKSLNTPKLKERLMQHHLSFNILDYDRNVNTHYHIPNTEKRKLLFEMVGKWWFFEKSQSPALALSEAIRFRNWFFKQPFAYLPKKFRHLVAQKGFCQAVEELTADEHRFLDDLILRMKQPLTMCGCIPQKRTAFCSRLDPPLWYDIPDLENVGNEVGDALSSGDFLYMVVYNDHDGLDRTLYTTLCRLFQETKKV